MMDIIDYQAIAFEWHCGQDSALYRFAIDGQPNLATYDETIDYITDLDPTDPRNRRLIQLADYLYNQIFRLDGE